MAVPFLTADRAAEVRERFGTPCYVYDRAGLEAAARQALAFPAPFGLTLRYAMKANPSRGVLALFRDLGLHIDASSDHEVERALRARFPPAAIQLTSQMPSAQLARWLELGVLFNASSLHQLEAFGRIEDSELRGEDEFAEFSDADLPYFTAWRGSFDKLPWATDDAELREARADVAESDHGVSNCRHEILRKGKLQTPC